MRSPGRVTWLCAAMLFLIAGVSSPAECPEATHLSKLSSGGEYDRAGPFDSGSVTRAVATRSAFGMTVFLSNAAFDARAAAARLTVSPVTGKGELVVAITYMSGDKSTPFEVGDYERGENVWDPMNIRADLGFGRGSDGFMYGFTTRKGTGSIVAVSDSQVCGTFDMEAGNGAVAGEFVATIVE